MSPKHPRRRLSLTVRRQRCHLLRSRLSRLPSCCVPTTILRTKRPAPDPPVSSPPAKKPQYKTPYSEFYQEQRPFLPAGLRNAAREKLIGQRWKALSEAEKAPYKIGAAASPTPYHAFSQKWRPLLRKNLSTRDTEKRLGQMWRAQNGTERTDHHISPPAPARAHVPVRLALSTTREAAGAGAAWSKGDDHLKAKTAVWRAVDEAALFQQTGGPRNAEREKLLVQLWISLSNADWVRRQLAEAVLPIPWTKALAAHRAPPAAPTSAPATPLPYNVPYNPPSYSLPAAPPSATLAVSRSPWPADLSTSFDVAPQTVDARGSTLLSDELRALPRSVLQALANTYGRTVAAAAAAAAGATAAPTPSAAPNSSSESAGLDLLMTAALA